LVVLFARKRLCFGKKFVYWVLGATENGIWLLYFEQWDDKTWSKQFTRKQGEGQVRGNTFSSGVRLFL